MKFTILKSGFFLFLFFVSFSAVAQDERAQLPAALRNAYFEVNIGSINYEFDEKQFENVPGYTFISVQDFKRPAVRLVLFGYEFNKYLSAQVSYMRPVYWVYYNYKNDFITDPNDRVRTNSVWMNVGGLTFKPQLPIGNHFSVFGEGGLGIITRSGFKGSDGSTLIKDVSYSTFLFGGGLKYHVNANWGLMLSSTYSPAKESVKQPATSFISAGFSYKLLPFTEKQLDKAAKTGYIHPKQMIQIGFTSNVLGYDVNNFLSSDKFPIFWGGNAEVNHGVSLNYQRNIFHGAKVFSLDWGVSASYWQSNKNKDDFFTLSVFPVIRFTFLHTKPLDAYFYYSVAGPTYISKKIIDDANTGEHFTFQDNMGTGIFFGEKRNLNAEIRIGHYSNGNVYPHNEAVKIPLTLNLGYAF